MIGWTLVAIAVALFVWSVIQEVREHQEDKLKALQERAIELDGANLARVASTLLGRMDRLQREILEQEETIRAAPDWRSAFRPYQTRIEDWRGIAGALLQAEVPNTGIARWVLKEYPLGESAFRYEMDRFDFCRAQLKKIMEDPNRWVVQNRLLVRQPTALSPGRLTT